MTSNLHLLRTMLFLFSIILVRNNVLLAECTDGELTSASKGEKILSTTTIPFYGQRLNFNYCVNHTPINSKPFAVLVMYEKEMANPNNAKYNLVKVNLYNNSDKSNSEYTESEYRDLYAKYHQDLVHSFRLAYYHTPPKGALRTDSSENMKKQFLYFGKFDNKVQLKTYILRYDGIPTGGTLVPFWIGTEEDISKITVRIVDLNNSQQDEFSEKVWTFILIKNNRTTQ